MTCHDKIYQPADSFTTRLHRASDCHCQQGLREQVSNFASMGFSLILILTVQIFSKPTNPDQDNNTQKNHQKTTDMARTVRTKQASLQQEGTLGDHSALYVPIRWGNVKRLGSVRQTWATSMNNQLTREVQRASKGLYVKLPNITKIAWVTWATIHNKACSLGPDAQVRVRLGPVRQLAKQEGTNVTRTGNSWKQM